ncbi:hypothetical protein ACLKA7_001225 [Drosophila subpalustris]
MKPGSGTGYSPWCSAGQPNYNNRNYRDCATADGNCASSKYYWLVGFLPGLCLGWRELCLVQLLLEDDQEEDLEEQQDHEEHEEEHEEQDEQNEDEQEQQQDRKPLLNATTAPSTSKKRCIHISDTHIEFISADPEEDNITDITEAKNLEEHEESKYKPLPAKNKRNQS